MATLMFELALTFYFAAAIVGILEIFKGSRTASVAALSFSASGFLLHSVSIVLRYALAGHLPIVSPHEATSFFAWCIVLIFFVIDFRYKTGLLGAFIMPIVFALMLAASMFSREVRLLDPVLRSNWLLFHTLFAFLANASFALAFGVGVMYLLQEHYVRSKHLGDLFHRLPSLQSLDRINYRLITVGVPFLVMAMITGSLWADSAWGSFWRWDPREVWSLITLLVFSMILHARLMAGWRGKRAAVLSIIGFATVLVAFFGIKLLKKGMHVFI